MPNPVMQPQVGYSPAPTQVQYQQTPQQVSVNAADIPVDTGFAQPQPTAYAPQVDPGTPVPMSVYDNDIPF